MDKAEQTVAKDERQLIEEQNKEDRLALEAVEELCKFGKSEFRSLDKDRNARITESELEQAIDGGRYSGKELDYLKVMKKHLNELQLFHHDRLQWAWEERKDDDDGVSWVDLNRLHYGVKDFIPKLEGARVAREMLNRKFSAIDADKSGELTMFELRAASTNTKFSYYDRTAINLTRQLFAADTHKWQFATDKNFWSFPVLKPDAADRFVELLEKKTGTRDVQLKWDIAGDLRK
jgi:hypothetical protein